MVAVAVQPLDERELQRYLARVGDRWPIDAALLGGARVDDLRGAGPMRERGEEYVVVLVSRGFDGVPWLERVYQAASLWDAEETGARADVHCYTPAEFARKRDTLSAVRAVCERGVDLREPLEPQLTLLGPSLQGDDPPMTPV